MESKLFLSYYSYNDDKFDMKDAFADSNSYIEALQKYSMQDSGFMPTTKKEDNIRYAMCDCVLYDDTNTELDIDKLVSYYNYDKKIFLIAELNLEKADDEFLTEFNIWEEETLFSNKQNKPNTTQELQILRAPKRDLKLVVKNKQNKDTFCTFVNTTLMQKIEGNYYAFLIDKIIFTKTFD